MKTIASATPNAIDVVASEKPMKAIAMPHVGSRASCRDRAQRVATLRPEDFAFGRDGDRLVECADAALYRANDVDAGLTTVGAAIVERVQKRIVERLGARR